MPDRLCLLSVHAHPDDEASKGAPTVARYHAEGVQAVLVCCTGGEEGDILNPAMDTPEVRADIGRVRMAELKASTDIIGYDETVLLGYRDSGMPDTEANARPDSFAQAPLDEAVGRLVAVIRRERPQVIITYGDNQTEYPHPDHLRVHEISVIAFDAAGDADRFPDAGPPFTPSKLYYSVWSGERFRQIHEKFEELGLTSPFDDKWLARMTKTEPFTTTIDVSGSYRGAGRGVEGPRDAGRPELAVLVRLATRGDARHPPRRRVPVGAEPRRSGRRDRRRPLCRGTRGAGAPVAEQRSSGGGAEEAPADDAGTLQQDQHHCGRRRAEQHERSRAALQRRRGRRAGLTAGRRRSTGATGPAARDSGSVAEASATRSARDAPRVGLAAVVGRGPRRGPRPCSRITVSRSSTAQPFTISGVTEPPPRRVSTTQSGRSSISHSRDAVPAHVLVAPAGSLDGDPLGRERDVEDVCRALALPREDRDAADRRGGRGGHRPAQPRALASSRSGPVPDQGRTGLVERRAGPSPRRR